MPITLPGRVTRAPKHPRERAAADAGPVMIKSPAKLPSTTIDLIHTKFAQHVKHAVTLITRSTVWFDDENGPRGGDDVRCRIEVHLTGRPPLLVEQRGGSPEASFAKALPRLVRQLARVRGKHNLTGRRTPSVEAAPVAPAKAKAPVRERREGAARRKANSKAARATVKLEASSGRPSRKSTRRSANRSKPSQGKERTAVAKAVTPSARTRRGR